MNVDMNKVKAEMAEHWDMDADTFDSYKTNKIFPNASCDWAEMDFVDANGDVKFYIEVNEDSEVWHFDWVH